MHPLFEERRRPINLGGHSSSTSQVSILNEAKAKREARQNNKRRLQNAVRIQAWWRGMREAKVVRQELRRAFEQDITGVTGLRCLVLIGQDERALGMWSNAMVSSGEGRPCTCPYELVRLTVISRVIASPRSWAKSYELVRSHKATFHSSSQISRR